MIKTLTNLRKQEKEKFIVPKGVQDVIPITAIYDDGIFQIGKDKFSKTYKFSDINYAVASREDKEAMFLEYSELLNSLDSGATTKITINNRRLNRLDFENNILIPMKGDSLDEYREEYNKILLEKATGANAIVQDKYMTISVNKKNIEDARNYFARVGADLIAHFGRLGSKCVELETDERLRIFHDFYRVGEESSFHFDIKETRKKGHSFKDYICPDSMEFEKDYFKMGDRYGRVLFLREYASYIKDSMVAELTDLNRNLMMSIDVVPVPTDEAVREAENRLLGVETNITNWQRRQNSNNNFSATVPYDMEQQKKEMKEFLDDLTTRDQRMMFAFSCTLRIGEMLGITLDCIDVSDKSIEEGKASIYINKELQRVNREILQTLDKKDVLFIFPHTLSNSHTVLVLKKPKTDTSERRVYLPKTVALMVREKIKAIEEIKELFGDEYTDYNLLFAHSSGRPIEGQVINRAMKKLIKENDLPDVVFHSVRHSSITYKLKWTGGDIKAVQGDSGHARAEMVQDVYSHILDEDRRANARRFDENFYQQKPEEAKEEVPQTETQNKAGVDPTALFQLLADPEMAKAFQNLLTIYQSKAANDK